MYRRRQDVIARQIADETLLVPIRGELAGLQRIFALDNVAEYIWQRLDEPVSLEAIRDGMVDEFAVSAEQAERDLQEFVAELLQAGLVEEGC